MISPQNLDETLKNIRVSESNFQDLQYECNCSALIQVVQRLGSNEVEMCFFKMSVGLKKWLTRSGPTSPQYPLQIDALKDSCNN